MILFFVRPVNLNDRVNLVWVRFHAAVYELSSVKGVFLIGLGCMLEIGMVTQIILGRKERTQAAKTGRFGLLPFHVIVEATCGDADAIKAVLKHYEGYIIALLTRRLYDEYGNSYLCIDEGLRSRIESKLTDKIPTFRVI